MKLNLNQTVYVRLTDLGRSTLDDQLAALNSPFRLSSYTLWPTAPDGRTRMQLWEVCRYLGHRMGNGLPLVCATEIEVEP